jgi:hypothetical protein
MVLTFKFFFMMLEIQVVVSLRMLPSPEVSLCPSVPFLHSCTSNPKSVGILKFRGANLEGNN